MPLYIVATPLGNMADLSPRAMDTLKQADILAAEDTRSARRLLSRCEISLEGKTLVSYGDHNESKMAPRLADWLSEGKTIAVLSEGGTPLVSDPGYRIVRAAIDADETITPIPGPCAAISALCASGLPVHGFIFRGFLSKKPGARQKVLESLRDREETLIFYESPQRLDKLLAHLCEVLGEDRPGCLAKEISKLHEAFWRGSLGELLARVQESKESRRLKGEWTVLVGGKLSP